MSLSFHPVYLFFIYLQIHQLMCENHTLRGRRGGSTEPAVNEEKFAAAAARSLWQTSPRKLQRPPGNFPPQITPSSQQHQKSDSLLRHQQHQQLSSTRCNITINESSNCSSSSNRPVLVVVKALVVSSSPRRAFFPAPFLPSETNSKPIAAAAVQRSNNLNSHLPRPNTMFETSSVFAS